MQNNLICGLNPVVIFSFFAIDLQYQLKQKLVDNIGVQGSEIAGQKDDGPAFWPVLNDQLSHKRSEHKVGYTCKGCLLG